MESIHIPILYWGIVMASFNLVSALLAKHAHIVIERLGEIVTFSLIVLLPVVAFFLMARIHVTLALLFPLFLWINNPLRDIFFADEFNKRTSSHVRATVLSTVNFCTQGLQMFALPILGYVADFYSLQTMFLVMAFTLAIVGVFVGSGLRLEMLKSRKS
jgi:MFS family permease